MHTLAPQTYPPSWSTNMNKPRYTQNTALKTAREIRIIISHHPCIGQTQYVIIYTTSQSLTQLTWLSLYTNTRLILHYTHAYQANIPRIPNYMSYHAPSFYRPNTCTPHIIANTSARVPNHRANLPSSMLDSDPPLPHILITQPVPQSPNIGRQIPTPTS